MSPRPDLGPKPRLGYTASPIERAAERRADATAVEAMKNLDGELGQVLVVMSGYNDPIGSIGDAIDAVVEEARDQGVDHVVWLSLRTSADVDYSDPQEQSSINTFREYNEQLFAAAADSDDFLQVADWATYSNGASAWFEYDGVHLTAKGADAVAVFIAGAVWGALHLLMSRTALGMFIQAIGINPQAARVAGLAVRCRAWASGVNSKPGIFASYFAVSAMAARSSALAATWKCGRIVVHSAAGRSR